MVMGTCCLLGPRGVPAVKILDLQNIGLGLFVNGESKQWDRS